MENLVALAADPRFVAPARALLNSIERNWRPADPSFGYLVLDCGLSPEDRAAMERTVAGGGALTFEPCAPGADHAAALQGGSHLSMATFARFELFRLVAELPAERILYIDSDALVLENCREVWGTEGAFAARWRTDAHLRDEYAPGFAGTLPYRYNVPQREMLRSPATSILHFIGRRKPWLAEPLPESQGGAEADALRRRLWREYAPS